ncbi:hypothetical protein D3C71_1412950 [compost metagenome]
MCETLQATEPQFGEERIEPAYHLIIVSQYLFSSQCIWIILEQRLQGRPDARVAIKQDLIAINQQRTVVSQFHGLKPPMKVFHEWILIRMLGRHPSPYIEYADRDQPSAQNAWTTPLRECPTLRRPAPLRLPEAPGNAVRCGKRHT